MADIPEIQIDKGTQEKPQMFSVKASQQGLANLTKAMVAARAKFPVIKKETNNPHWNKKYADLETIISSITPALMENGLMIFQFPQVVDREVFITTILSHTSGEWIEFTTNGPAGQGTRFDIQTVGSAETYLRRYSIQSLLLLAAEDDDGNAVSKSEPKEPLRLGSNQPRTAAEKPSSLSEPEPGLPTQDQSAELAKRLRSFGQDNRLLRDWIEKHSGKAWKETPYSVLLQLTDKLEAAHKEGKITELLAKEKQ